MPRTVIVDGKPQIFPDDATDAEISEALNAVPASTAKATPKARTWTDTAVDALPMVGGAIGGIVGGIGGTVAGMGVGGVPGAAGGAALGGAAGEAARQLVNRARGADAPASAGAAAGDIATQGAVQGALEVGGQMVPRALAAGAQSVYRGYLKPSLAKASIGKAQEIVQTALKEGIPITGAGIGRARAMIAELNGQVNALLKQSSDTVDLRQIADRVRAYAQTHYNRAGRAPEEFEAAMKVADRIDNHPSMALPNSLTTNPGVTFGTQTADMATANQIKRDLQQGVGATQYGVPSAAGKTTEKVAASEMRQAIESKVPAVGALNARESKLLDAAKAISRAVEREANQSMSHGVKTLVAGAIGGEEYARKGDPYAALATAALARGALSPQVATYAAIVAARLAKVHPMAPPQALRLAVAALSEEHDGNQPEK